MKSMRTKILGFLTAALLLLSFQSGIAFGAEKQYMLTVNGAASSSTAPFIFTFTNDGNSSFNSLTLSVPPGWSIPATVVPTASRGTITVNALRTVVTVNAINLPTGAGQFMTVTIPAVTGTATCGAQSGDWSAQPWTGTPVGSGQTFRIKGPFPSTSLPASCFTVTSSTSNAAQGSISPSGTQSVNAGAQASFTITPTAAYNIGTTGGTCTGTLTGNTFTTAAVNADCTVIANFSLKTFTVTPVAGAGGSMSPSTPQTVGYNQTTAFTLTPNSGFHTTTASGCGGSLSTDKLTFTTGQVTANCTVNASFAANAMTVTAPANVYITVPFDVTVTQDGPPAAVGLSSNCGYAVTSTSTTGNTTTFSGAIPTIPPSGSCTLTATATGYPSQQKTVSVYTGTLGCFPNDFKGGELDPRELKTYVKASDQGKWGLVRGNNKDNVGCVAVPYIFDLNVFSTPQIASFIVPNPAVTPFQKVAAEYVVVWGRVAVDATGDVSSWTTKRPYLSWGTASAPVPGSSDYVPALSCVLDPDNPDLVGTYANGFVSVPQADLNGLLPFIPNIPPFSTSPHPQFRPFLADNVTPQRAKMCIAQQGWTAVGKDTPTGPTLVQYWTRVIDQADGFMSLD